MTKLNNLLLIFLYGIIYLFNAQLARADCSDSQLSVTVLGSGGPELAHGRASTSYWVRDGEKSLFLIDVGSGSAINLNKAGGSIADLKAILVTHLHVDHINDLPALIKQSFFTGRKQDLLILGPTGNALVPDISVWLQRQFGADAGIYAYLSEYLTPNAMSDYKIKPVSVSADLQQAHPFEQVLYGYRISAIAVSHGAIPALAWKITKGACSVVFSGDTSNQGHTLEPFLEGVDWLVIHNAIPENGDRVAKRLHMTPSQIGEIAKTSKVNHLVLSHFMQRSEAVLPQTLNIIRQHYAGPILLADDLTVYHMADDALTDVNPPQKSQAH